MTFDDETGEVTLTKKEALTIYEFMAHQYISYENLDLLDLVRNLIYWSEIFYGEEK